MTIIAEGIHTVEFWSEDKAGNQLVQVLRATFTPVQYEGQLLHVLRRGSQ